MSNATGQIMDEFDKLFVPAKTATDDSKPARDDESDDPEWAAVETPDAPRTTATTSSFSELNLTPTRTASLLDSFTPISPRRLPSSPSQSRQQRSDQPHPTSILPRPTTLPALSSLPRPDLLFSSTPPVPNPYPPLPLPSQLQQHYHSPPRQQSVQNPRLGHPSPFPSTTP